MTRTSKIFATSMLFAITLASLPHNASADTSATVTASSAIKGEATDKEYKDWSSVIAPAVATLVGVIF
jgi:hypothetical protein